MYNAQPYLSDCSACAHLKGRDDLLVKPQTLIELLSSSWKPFLTTAVKDHEIAVLKKHERTGRPLGEDELVEALEVLMGLKLKRRKPGPKKKDK